MFFEFLRRKLFVIRYRKSSLGYTSVYQKCSGIEIFYASERMGITFLRRKIYVTRYRKVSFRNISVFQKTSCIAKFNHKKGLSLNSVEKFLSHSADKNLSRTLLCFDRVLVSKTFMHRRGGITVLSKIFFISQDRKIFAREPFCVSENVWYGKKFMVKKGMGGYHDFPSNETTV